MSIDMIILIAAWVLTALMLILFVPKAKFKEAQVIFLFKQFITWISGLAAVEFRLIEYPVRFFSYANKTSFTFEYFVYPAICVIFNLYYPNHKKRLQQLLHYVYYCTGITIFEVSCEKYTNIIHYLHWSWYITWITLFITFYISRKYYVWFFDLDQEKRIPA